MVGLWPDCCYAQATPKGKMVHPSTEAVANVLTDRICIVLSSWAAAPNFQVKATCPSISLQRRIDPQPPQRTQRQ
jgi:hypothetical protein